MATIARPYYGEPIALWVLMEEVFTKLAQVFYRLVLFDDNSMKGKVLVGLFVCPVIPDVYQVAREYLAFVFHRISIRRCCCSTSCRPCPSREVD